MSAVTHSINRHGFHADPESGVCYRTLDFLGFPGYRVGDDGSVWSRLTNTGTTRGNPRLWEHWRRLTIRPDQRGKCRVVLYTPTHRRVRMFVHRLVLEAFVGPCPPGMECCHYPDPLSNCLNNVRWDTKQANMSDQVKHGTFVRGERNGRAALTERTVEEIRRRVRSEKEQHGRIRKGFYLKTARDMNIPYWRFHRAAHGDTWQHI